MESAHLEHPIHGAGIKPDIYLDGSTRKLIEIVVTHEPEEHVHRYCRDQQIPLVIVYVSGEEMLETLQRGTIEAVVQWDKCLCYVEQEAREAAFKRRIAGYRSILESSTGNLQVRVQPMTKDRYGSPLYPHVQNNLMRSARKVVDLGFTQSHTRPTLFSARRKIGRIYVDFDSTEVMRIWEVGCEPALYGFPSKGVCRECLLSAVGEILKQRGVAYRRHFMDSESHDCTEGDMTAISELGNE